MKKKRFVVTAIHVTQYAVWDKKKDIYVDTFWERWDAEHEAKILNED